VRQSDRRDARDQDGQRDDHEQSRDAERALHVSPAVEATMLSVLSRMEIILTTRVG
jgi:hypothetical protein